MFAKEPPSKRTTTDQMNGQTIYRQEGRTANKVLPQWGLTSKLQVLCYFESSVLNSTDSFQNPLLRQYPKPLALNSIKRQ